MSITPQLIKDQEFEVKFRGFDPIEVKDYLETIADEFFELQEQCKEQEEELDGLREAKDSSEEYSTSLVTYMEFTRKISDELKDGCGQKEEKVKELTAEVEELQLRIADMEEDGKEHEEELSTIEAGRKEVEEALKEAQAESDSLRSRLEIQQEQINDLKKEEVDFKATLAAAQRFAEEMKEKSTVEAEEMIESANDEIAQIRDDAQAELDRLPVEISILEKKKHTVRAELKAILENYMETIDVFAPATENEPADDTGLFQKIELNEDGSLNPEDLKDVDEKALGSLLGGESDAVTNDDTFNLNDMFGGDAEDEEKKEST
jgi:DivIVA domain-containing protein